MFVRAQHDPPLAAEAAGQSAQQKAPSARRRRGRLRRPPVWMLLPGLVAVIVVVLIPTALTVVLSLLNLTVATIRDWLSAPFDGLHNFINAFTTPNALGTTAGQSLLTSIEFSLLATVIVTPIGFLAALSVHQPFRGRGLVRGLYLIPHVIPMFVTALLARIIFLNQTGPLDTLLSHLGIASRNMYWLIGPHAFWAMVIVDAWTQWPFIYLLVLAALQGIPREQFEAAELDGASSIGKIRYIMLPQISGMLKLAVLLSTLYHFGNFTLAYVMFSSPPPDSVSVLPISTYFDAFTTFDYGIASAIAVVTMVVLLIPGFIYIRMSRLTREDIA
jgi:multiple sugar transport system permease protein